MDDVLSVPQGDFTLHRDHHRPGPLRAWDAADEYLLTHVAEAELAGARTLVVNDGFGALTLASTAAGFDTTSWSDSVVAIDAALANLRRNDLDPSAATVVPSTEAPDGPFDLVLIKVPRTLAFLEYQLRHIPALLSDDAVVLGAAMTKAVHRSTIQAFETNLGPTPTSLARKKARLLLPEIGNRRLPAPPPPAPVRWTTDDGIEVTNFANVFSSQRLDEGTRLLLANLPEPAARSTVIDLGCGNGVVAATIGRRHPDVALICCDESHHAIASARATVDHPSTTFLATDVLDGVDDESADAIVVNPPFHAGAARTDDVSRRMFDEARRVLRSGGVITVVGNRHLDHHVQLKRRFADVRVVASSPKFVVVSARKA